MASNALSLAEIGARLEILLHVRHQLFVAAEMMRGRGAMAGLAKVAIVPGRDISGDQLALARRERARPAQQNLRQCTQGFCRLGAKANRPTMPGNPGKFDVGHVNVLLG